MGRGRESISPSSFTVSVGRDVEGKITHWTALTRAKEKAMKMQINKKLPQTIAEIRGHNDMVDWLTRAVSAGIVALEKGDSVPARYEEPEIEVACPVCQERGMENLSVLYYEKVYRAFKGFTPSGRVEVHDYNDPQSLDEHDERESDLAGYFMHCETCKKVSRLPDHIKLEW